MSKKFSIIIPQDAGTDEITDTIADVFGVVMTVEGRLKDGFQLEDVLALIQVEPDVREVINDFPVFISQFRQLNGPTAIAAVKAAKERTILEFGELGKIGTFVYDFLIQIATTFAFLEATVVGGMQELENWKTVFAQLNPPANPAVAA